MTSAGGIVEQTRALVAALRSSETVAKAFVTVTDQGVVSVTNFASSVIVGRACSKGELGLYMLGFSIVLFATNMQTALISSAHIIYSPRMHGRDRKQYTGSTFIHQVTYAAVAVVGLAVAGLLLPLAGGDWADLSPIVWTLTCLVPFILLREYARQVCFAAMRAPVALALDTFVAVVQICGLLLLARSGVLLAHRAFALLGAGCAAASLVWLLTMRTNLVLRLGAAASDFGRNWGFSKWLVACNMVYLGSNMAYPWLLVYYHGKEANGVLGACTLALVLANPFMLGMHNFLGPKIAHALAEGGVARLQQVTWRATVFFAVTMGSFCLAMAVGGGWLVALVYSKEYAGNGLLVAVLALGQLPVALTLPTNSALSALERSDKHFRSLMVSLAVTAAIGIWLVKAYGPLGVAWGLVATHLASALYKYVAYRHEIGVRLAEGNAT